jgi:putative mycofactocin binding protein MftB
MASVASTDSAASPGKDSPGNIRYAVSPSVRVRKESFGLLFYDTKNSRLIFVYSRNLLKILSPEHGEKVITVSPRSAAQAKMKKLLDDLVGKGLLVKL